MSDGKRQICLFSETYIAKKSREKFLCWGYSFLIDYEKEKIQSIKQDI